MSRTLAEKIQILKSFDKKHRDVLDTLMSGKKFTIPELAKKMGYAVSTVRNFQTDIYKACGVLELNLDDDEKRDYIVKEYAEAYVKMDQIPSEPKPEAPKPEPVTEIPVREPEVVQIPQSKPTINITPPAPRRNRRPVTFLLIGFAVIAVISILVLSIIIRIINNPSSLSPSSSNARGIVHNQTDKVYMMDDVYIKGEVWQLGDCGTAEQPGFEIYLDVDNSSGRDYTMTAYPYDLSLYDSNDRTYELISVRFNAGEPSTEYSQVIHSGYGLGITTCWANRNPAGVKYYDLTINNIIFRILSSSKLE